MTLCKWLTRPTGQHEAMHFSSFVVFVFSDKSVAAVLAGGQGGATQPQTAASLPLPTVSSAAVEGGTGSDPACQLLFEC